MRFWDALSGEAIGKPLITHSNSVTCVAISRDGKHVLSSFMDNIVRQWDVSEQRNVTEQRLSLTSPDEVCSDSTLRTTVSLSVCANRNLVVSGSCGGTVQKWDMLTGEAVGRPMLGHARGSCVHSVAISRDGTLIVSGGSDGMVRRWDASTGEAVYRSMDGHSG